MADDLGEKTEDATPKKKQQARESGNIPKSQDLSSALLLLGASILMFIVLMPTLGQFKLFMQTVFDGDELGNPVNPDDAVIVASYAVSTLVRVAAPILLSMFVIAYVIGFSQVGFLLTTKTIQPSLSKLNPISGIKKLFGLTALVKAVMDVLKVIVVVLVAVFTIRQFLDSILVLPFLEPIQILQKVGWFMVDLAMRLVAVLMILGLIDFTYQRWKNKEDMKMTKQQVKDEMKQSEGDPQVKKRRMRMQQQIAMQRISASVPKADVIVTNPEHFAVAIRYESQEMNAPKVIAKGADYLALRIRQIALYNGIPIVQRPPLARALYKQVPVGGEIPPDFFKAVAEVLSYVYGLGNRKAG